MSEVAENLNKARETSDGKFSPPKLPRRCRCSLHSKDHLVRYRTPYSEFPGGVARVLLSCRKVGFRP